MKIIDEKLLARHRGPGRCAFCRRESVLLHPHHLIRRGVGGGTRLDIRLNLLSLCPYDHDSHHRGGHPLHYELLAVKAAEVGLLQDDLQERLWRIVRAPKKCALCVCCAGRGCKFCLGVGIFDYAGEIYREPPRHFSGAMRRGQ